MLLRRNDPFLETPLALFKLKDYVFHHVSLTWSSLRECSEPMEDRESWRKSLSDQDFPVSNFPNLPRKSMLFARRK